MSIAGEWVAREVRRARVRAAARLRPVLPPKARLVLRRLDRALDPAMIALYRRRTGETRPIPPRSIRERNTVEYVDSWFKAADQAARPLHELLEVAGHRIEEFERVLDFGCGAGKVVTTLVGRGPELHACDIHEPSIAWLRRSHPEIRAVATEFDPPLPYQSGAFDLLWAWSVLTHIDAERQQRWMQEWARVVRPGGVVLATFNGPTQAARLGFSLDGQDTRFRRHESDGNFYVEFAGTTEPYGDTFNQPDALAGVARGAGFEVVDVVVDAVWNQQDCLVLRRAPG